ncbi:ABC transporter ATP-binding protein [Gallaecimonas sp. GXIMD4217]|uniref:ABC transporter ATP-binding protein n=1 Tax=Gallaecimonas sp. GXIMD4217 TaxID=3131927 RepID=UPI00311B2D32
MSTQAGANPFRWSQILALAHPYRTRLVKAHVIALFATAAAVPLPLMMPLLVDEVLLNQPGTGIRLWNQVLPQGWQQPTAYILATLVLVLLLRISSVLLNIWQSRQFTLIGKAITFRLRKSLIEHLARMEIRAFESRGAGSIGSHLITDLETIDRFIGESLGKFLIGLLTIIGTAVVLLLIDWQLGLMILVLNPFIIWLSRRIGRKVKVLKGMENQAFERFQGQATETLDAMQEVRSSGRMDFFRDRLLGSADHLRQRAQEFSWKSEAAGRFSFLIFLSGFEVFRAIAMLMVLLSDLSVGEIFAVFGYLWFMMGPVQELLGMQYSYYGASAALDRLARLQALPVETDSGKATPLRQPVTLSFEEVHFAYEPDRPVLQGVNLEVPAGAKVALVGTSGGGKSTLIQLLLGLYRPLSGQIRLNGEPIEDIGLAQVRSQVGTVLQHPVLFNDSVRNNLCLGRNSQDGELWQALAVAQLDDFVRGLPEGLDTQVGSRGVRLSGGQRQRLAIARLVLKDPALVILDEATSALDSETEAALHQALGNFLKGRTTLIVAHRHSAVRQADLVYVLDDGKVVESGRHDELLARDGIYQALYGAH